MASDESPRQTDSPRTGDICSGPLPLAQPVSGDTRNGTPTDGTFDGDGCPLPPPPSPIPEGVERVARALGFEHPPMPAGPIFPIHVPSYKILGELGRGGMGVVYRARHVQLNRDVALKMVLHGAHASQREVRQARVEAESIARLQHPHIVQIFEVGEIDGCPYCALEYVEGGSLADRIRGTPQPHRGLIKSWLDSLV